jgi:type VI secretion system protein ImpJ
MKYLQRVVWAKGMLLTPQHFQAHSNHVEDSLQFRFGASNFANWGLTDLRLDLEMLAKGELSVTSVSGILPDGSLLSCPGVDPVPLTRPFSTYFTQNTDLLDVHLALPVRLTGQNVAMSVAAPEDADGNTRYRSKIREVRDENGLDDDRPVAFAQRQISIVFGSKAKDGYAHVRIAQVRRTPTGFELNPDFIPPLLDVAASSTLMELLKRQVEILSQKSQTLSGVRSQRSGAAAFNLDQAQSFFLLQTVNTFLAEFTHMFNIRRGHPEPLYVAMLRLAGALGALPPGDDVRTLPAYDHDNLGVCFLALDKRIRDLVEAGVPSKCVSIPLKQSQRTWTGTFTDDSWLKNTQIYVAISANLGADEIIRRVPLLAKVASPDEIETMVRFATPGLTLRHLTPPGAIPFRPENQYFAVNQAGRLWDSVTRGRVLSLFLPPELAGAKPELFVLLP